MRTGALLFSQPQGYCRTWTRGWTRARTSTSTHAEAGWRGTWSLRPARSTASSTSWGTSWKSCSRVSVTFAFGETSRLPSINFIRILNSVSPSLVFSIRFVSGVLETNSERDRTAFRKAKVLYRSCMNESECCFTRMSCRNLIAVACISIRPLELFHIL